MNKRKEGKKSKSEKHPENAYGSSDKVFLGEIKKEIEELDKELGMKYEKDDLCFSSESEESKKNSLEISISSEFSVPESPLNSLNNQESKKSMKKTQILKLQKKIEEHQNLGKKTREKELEK